MSYSKIPSNSNQQQFERKGLVTKSVIVNNTTENNNNINDELIESNNKLISENKDLKNIITDLTN